MSPTPHRPGPPRTARWCPLLAAAVLAVAGCGSATTSSESGSNPSASGSISSVSSPVSSRASASVSAPAVTSAPVSSSPAPLGSGSSSVPAPAPPADPTPSGGPEAATPVPTGGASVSPGAAPGQTLTGTIAPGVESGCVVLTGENGTVLATLVGVPADDLLAQGAAGPVRVRGEYVTGGMSFCQQGRMFQVNEVLPG